MRRQFCGFPNKKLLQSKFLIKEIGKAITVKGQSLWPLTVIALSYFSRSISPKFNHFRGSA